MTVISRRAFRPFPGKAALAQSRIKRLGDLLASGGGRIRIAAVAWGDGARDLHLYGIFPNHEAGAKAFEAAYAHPEGQKLRAESESDPASVWEGPEVWRSVYGEPQPNFPVLLQREYQLDRRNLKHMVELCPEVQALLPDRPVLGVVPVISGDMARFMAVYYAKSLTDLGEMIDKVGMSDAFQAIVVRAAEFGTLTKSRAVVTL
jgi:hypothetical protein